MKNTTTNNNQKTFEEKLKEISDKYTYKGTDWYNKYNNMPTGSIKY